MIKPLSITITTLIVLSRITISFSFSQGNIKWNNVKSYDYSATNNISNNNKSNRKKQKLNGKIPIISRTVPLKIETIPFVTIWELQNPSKLIEMWWNADLDPSSSIVSKEKIGDPFGVVFWPGSMLASQFLGEHRNEIVNATVLMLGAGTGVEAQASALLGAKKVIATDISKLTLKLLNYGADYAGLGDIIQPVQFDLYSKELLPECDIVVAADVLYNEDLARQIGKRCVELLSRANAPKLVVTDSQRFHGTDFLSDVNDQLMDIGKELKWEYFLLQNITGSGVMVEGDQIYDAKVRMVNHGWK
jgi:predicted nicotinamide N-methyase